MAGFFRRHDRLTGQKTEQKTLPRAASKQQRMKTMGNETTKEDRLSTERLILRPWCSDDAEALYALARDERVGPAAGWPPHRSVEESAEIIRTVFSAPETYAVVLRETSCIGLIAADASNIAIAADEAEVGYWLGVPYWGRGLMTEALRALMRRAFKTLGYSALWCGWFDGNIRSQHVQEKCGFRYLRAEHDQFWPLTGVVATEHFSRISREEWAASVAVNDP